ncbi:hypothetical protein [Kitasatospora sp. CB01950]|uniref:hypothetical protein n=1 Tax=Kitasatospora sp. CB01950 TaxID=1703930 RepID=UPI00093BC446|nr:hypothetical protein [Kitasatospora sp. CB01950]OKJ05673.1 hypothetical protein AMK19_25645 [Kitasatospora sp. CB01950]
MNWLVLYARSRQVPLSAAVVAAVALSVWALVDGAPDGSDDLGTTAFVLAANVLAAIVGLGGQDAVLDRTAAIRWAPRRAAHVLLIGAAAGAVLLAVQAVGPHLAGASVVVRDSAGLAGLAAFGAACWGTTYGWTLPTGWLAFTLLVPPIGGTPGRVAMWLNQPAGTTASTVTASALFLVGTTLYAFAGPRR